MSLDLCSYIEETYKISCDKVYLRNEEDEMLIRRMECNYLTVSINKQKQNKKEDKNDNY